MKMPSPTTSPPHISMLCLPLDQIISSVSAVLTSFCTSQRWDIENNLSLCLHFAPRPVTEYLVTI